jgi:hypothetical protein
LGSLVTSANVTATGNIDDYYDEDYYQVTVPSGTSYLIFILTAENPNYSLYYGNELLPIASPVTVPAGTSAISIPIRVVSSDQSFDESEPYTLSVQKLPASYDPSLNLLITTPDNSITVQYNNYAREEVYINGHLITWWFEDLIEFPKNSEGSIVRQVNFSQKAAVGPYDPEPVRPVFARSNGAISYYSSAPIYYTSTHRDAEGELKFMITVENCRVVNWNYGNGFYDLIDTGSTGDTATVIVNPDTGHIFDVLNPNIIYQYSGGVAEAVAVDSYWYFDPPLDY